MDSRLTAKLFHTIVVLGVGLTAAGCGDDDSNTGKTQQQGNGTTSGTVAQNTSSTSGTTAATSSSTSGSATSSTSGSSTAGWACCT